MGIHPSAWRQDSRNPGQLVRCMKYMIPVDNEVPSAIKMLVDLPDVTPMTVIYRLQENHAEVVLYKVIVAHDVPFGDKFTVEEKMVFVLNPSPSGLLYRKWVDVVWSE